jgi:hypothetical protein
VLGFASAASVPARGRAIVTVIVPHHALIVARSQWGGYTAISVRIAAGGLSLRPVVVRMEYDPAPDKIRAIYRLRTAVEDKVHAEQTLRSEPSAEHRDALLEAIVDVDTKTLEAISACLDCEHEPDRKRSPV